MAAFEDVENVLEDGAGGRGDDADARGEGGEREFAGGVEEAFELEAVAKFFEGEAEGAVADGLERIGDELHLTAAFVDADAAAGENLQAILGTKAEQLRARSKDDGRELGVAVFQREVDVAAGGEAAIGDFAFDADLAELLLNVAGERGDQRFHGPDAGRGWECGRGLGRRDGEEQLLEEQRSGVGIRFAARHWLSVSNREGVRRGGGARRAVGVQT